MSRFPEHNLKATGNRLHDYHLGELHLARTPSDPRHIMPTVGPEESALDIGCGAGQTLIVACPNRHSCGLDIDMEALRFGRTLTSDVSFVQGSAEQLPYASEQFDIVISRVTLLYTDLPTSLAEIHRVLKPGGHAWITLDSIRRPLKLARMAGTLKGWIWFSYVVANSMMFHLTGKLFRLPGKPMESFQTTSRVLKCMRSAGFEDTKVQRGWHFLVTASKPKRSGPEA